MRRPLTARMSIGSVRSSRRPSACVSRNITFRPEHECDKAAAVTRRGTCRCSQPSRLQRGRCHAHRQSFSRPTAVRDQFARAYLTVCSHEPHFSGQSSCEPRCRIGTSIRLHVFAVMLTPIGKLANHNILKTEVNYVDLGADHFERRNKTQTARRLVKRLESLGLTAEIRPAA